MLSWSLFAADPHISLTSTPWSPPTLHNNNKISVRRSLPGFFRFRLSRVSLVSLVSGLLRLLSWFSSGEAPHGSQASPAAPQPASFQRHRSPAIPRLQFLHRFAAFHGPARWCAAPGWLPLASVVPGPPPATAPVPIGLRPRLDSGPTRSSLAKKEKTPPARACRRLFSSLSFPFRKPVPFSTSHAPNPPPPLPPTVPDLTQVILSSPGGE